MSNKNLVIIDEAAEVASGEEYGVIDLAVIRGALDLANRVYANKDSTTNIGDDRFTLRAAIQDLSDAMRAVCGQLVQLEAGVRSGRIAVTDKQQ